MRKKNRISYAQKQLPFSGTARALVSPFKYEYRAFAALGSVLGIVAVAYGVCVGVSIAHVAARATLVEDTRALSAAAAALEHTYLAETRGITESYAISLGFGAPERRVYLKEGSALASAHAR